MSEHLPRRMSADLIGRLRSLAERRRAHFIDLHESGRWKRYFHSEREFAAWKQHALEQAEATARLDDPPAT